MFNKLKILLLSFLTLICLAGYAQESFNLSGQVIDSESNNIPNATIQYGNLFFASDNHGAFELSHQGELIIKISAVGFETIIDTLLINSDAEVLFQLQKTIQDIDEVTIEGKRQENSTILNKIKIQEIKQTPSITGTPDLYSSIKTKPGVQSNTEGQKGLIIRGGSYDQSTTYVDGVPVVGSSHLFGLLSMFQTDCIDNVNLYNGYKPLKFGTSLGPAIEINLKEEYSKHQSNSGSLSSSVISSHIQTIVSNKNFFMQIGLRNSNLFLIQDLIDNTINTKESRVISPEYKFQDVTLKTSYLFKNQKLQFLHLRSSDQIRYDIAFTNNERKYLNSMSWKNYASSINWRCYTENSTTLYASLIHTKYNTNLNSKNTIPFWDSDNSESIWRNSVSEFDNVIETVKFTFSADKPFSNSVNLNYGIQHKRSVVTPNSQEFWEDESQNNDVAFAGNRIVNNSSFFLEISNQISSNASCQLGFRTNMFKYGDQTELHFNPRFVYRHSIQDRLGFNVYSIRSSQDIHLITLNSFGFIPELWIAPNESMPTQRSWLTGLKVDYSFESTNFYLDFYLRGMSNLLEFKEDIDFNNSTTSIVQESIVNEGQGAVLGLEFSMKSSFEKLNYDVSYSFGKSSRLFKNLNQGNVYPFAFDIRHDASIILAYKFNNRISISALYTFSTGRALNINDQVVPIGFTTPLGYTNTQWVSYNQPQNRNSYRLGNVSRLDWNISWNKNVNFGLFQIQLGVYNTLNNLNPYSAIITNEENGNQLIEEIGLIPLMPNLNISFSWD